MWDTLYWSIRLFLQCNIGLNHDPPDITSAERNKVFATNSNCQISISLQPQGVNLDIDS